MPNKKWTTNDIPNLSGKVFIITGANQGLGLEATRVIAGRGGKVVLAIRTLSKGEAAIEKVRADNPAADLELLRLDLSSLESVRTAAEELRERFDRIDVLINNAGAMHAPVEKTKDGFGIQFGTNHLGHFAWTGLLLDRLLSVPGSRVVVHSSIAHTGVEGIDFDALPNEPEEQGNFLNQLVFRNQATQQANAAYGRSKLANMLFTYELQRRLTAIGAPTIAVAAHPGLTHTQLLHDIPGTRLMLPLMSFMTQSVEDGVLPILRAATDPSVLGGQYYGPGERGGRVGSPVVITSSLPSYNGEAQRRCWEVSEKLTEVHYQSLEKMVN